MFCLLFAENVDRAKMQFHHENMFKIFAAVREFKEEEVEFRSTLHLSHYPRRPCDLRSPVYLKEDEEKNERSKCNSSPKLRRIRILVSLPNRRTSPFQAVASLTSNRINWVSRVSLLKSPLRPQFISAHALGREDRKQLSKHSKRTRPQIQSYVLY